MKNCQQVCLAADKKQIQVINTIDMLFQMLYTFQWLQGLTGVKINIIRRIVVYLTKNLLLFLYVC